ncbi:MAG TPA: GNAT family N-acetyltransferase [Anaerolineaceae bacterium]|nr:GNAT family N-acetyltransferase [Anaerolineaceae bacterium]
MNSKKIMAAEISTLTEADRPWVRDFIINHWCSPEIVVHSEVYSPENLEGYKAIIEDRIAGLITWVIRGSACEIITLNSTIKRNGVGGALLQAAEDVARGNGCTRCWLMTTNDNLAAVQFYRHRGYRITAIAWGAVKSARRIKPGIPQTGENGIPICYEITLEKKL